MAAMMATMFSALTTGGTAAAGAGAAAAAGAGIGWGTVASVASTVVGGLMSISSANQEAAALESQAVDAEVQATQETLQGREQAIAAMRQLNDDLAQTVVAGYASGLTGSGSVAAAQDDARKAGESNVSMARNNAEMAAARRRQQAGEYRQQAAGVRQGGIFKAVSGGLSLFSRVGARG